MAKKENSVIENNVEVVKTDSRKVLEIRKDMADVEITAGDHTDVLKDVPLTLEKAEQVFGKEETRNSVYGLAISQFFTDEANYLRVNGVTRQNKEKKKMAETVKRMSKEEILASLSEEQKKALGLV